MAEGVKIIKMSLMVRLILFFMLALALTACTTPPVSANSAKNTVSPSDQDAITLIALEEQARQMAQKSQGEVLRQVDTDLTTFDFQFVDYALTREITIFIPELNAPTEKWSTTVNLVSPLLSSAQPDMDLSGLKIGPNRVAQAITSHWAGCGVRGIILYPEKGKLTWLAFCNTPEGVVSGTIENETAVFQPSTAPPASIPAIATPLP